jgi:ubiquinone/menaquinone biosynthesis C-methylase UbiE
MTADGDVSATERNVEVFGTGRLARRRAKVIAKVADVAMAAMPVPLRVLDIGCRDGRLVRELVERLPNVLEISGIDPVQAMVDAAREFTGGLPRFRQALPERLPFPDAHFDLVVTAMSFRHWADQERGLSEVARVLTPDGVFVLVDAKTGRDAVELLDHAQLRFERRETVYRRLGLVPAIRAFIASG